MHCLLWQSVCFVSSAREAPDSKGLTVFCRRLKVGRCSNPALHLLYSQSESRAQIRLGVVPVSGGFLPGRRRRPSAIRRQTIRTNPRTRPPIPRTAREPAQEVRMRRGVCLFVRCSQGAGLDSVIGGRETFWCCVRLQYRCAIASWYYYEG